MFCKKCGKEMQEGWTACPNCGEEVQKHGTIGENEQKDKKGNKPIYKKIWFWTLVAVITIIFFALTSGNDSSDEVKTQSKNSSVVKEEEGTIQPLEDIGGFSQWQEDGFPGKVRTNIMVGLPVVSREVNTYAVEIGAINPAIILIAQEDASPAIEWDWLMNAQPFEEDSDKAYFKATLLYLGKEVDGVPAFIVSDIESY